MLKNKSEFSTILHLFWCRSYLFCIFDNLIAVLLNVHRQNRLHPHMRLWYLYEVGSSHKSTLGCTYLRLLQVGALSRTISFGVKDVEVMDLYSAAYHGNVKSIKKLLGRSQDKAVNRQLLCWRHPHGGATALYVACEFGHLEVAKILLEAGAPPDQAREDGATPLYKACQDVGRLDIARLLLKSGAVADQVDSAGMTPLWVACHQGKTELAELLLDAKADPTRKVQGWSPLDLARKDKREELVKLILGLPDPTRCCTHTESLL